MRKMKGFPFVALLVAVVGAAIFPAFAWWDEGHMLVGEIANQLLSEEERSRIVKVLEYWNGPYPGMSHVAQAATWADHVKCTTKKNFCGGLSHFDFVEYFDTWHFISIPYNPEKLELKPIYEMLPLPSNGAVWALEKLYCSLTGQKWRAGGGTDGEAGSKVDLEPWKNQGSNEAPVGSSVSWNLGLRLLIHILGDLHQPLHAIEAFHSLRVNGDDGGSLVPVDVPGLKVRTLHELWDTAGGAYVGSWPLITPQDIQDEAIRIMKDNPQESFGNRLKNKYNGLNFAAIAEESFEVCTANVYKEFPFGNLTHDFFPYKPSDEYMKKAAEISRQQIALGGYRLANVLKHVAQRPPGVMAVQLDGIQINEKGEGNTRYWKWLSFILATALMVVTLLYVCGLRSKRRIEAIVGANHRLVL